MPQCGSSMMLIFFEAVSGIHHSQSLLTYQNAGVLSLTDISIRFKEVGCQLISSLPNDCILYSSITSIKKYFTFANFLNLLRCSQVMINVLTKTILLAQTIILVNYPLKINKPLLPLHKHQTYYLENFSQSYFLPLSKILGKNNKKISILLHFDTNIFLLLIFNSQKIRNMIFNFMASQKIDGNRFKSINCNFLLLKWLRFDFKFFKSILQQQKLIIPQI